MLGFWIGFAIKMSSVSFGRCRLQRTNECISNSANKSALSTLNSILFRSLSLSFFFCNLRLSANWIERFRRVSISGSAFSNEQRVGTQRRGMKRNWNQNRVENETYVWPESGRTVRRWGRVFRANTAQKTCEVLSKRISRCNLIRTQSGKSAGELESRPKGERTEADVLSESGLKRRPEYWWVSTKRAATCLRWVMTRGKWKWREDDAYVETMWTVFEDFPAKLTISAEKWLLEALERRLCSKHCENLTR